MIPRSGAELAVFFMLLPAFIFTESGAILSYSWRNFMFMESLLYDQRYIEEGLFIITAMAFSFTVGVAASTSALREKRTTLLRSYSTRPMLQYTLTGSHLRGNRGLLVAAALLLLLWIMAATYQFASTGWSLSLFLLPVRGAEGERSGYMRLMFMVCPPALVAISYWYYGRWRAASAFFTVLAIISAFSTSQRREAVTIALFILSLHVFLDPKSFESQIVPRRLYWARMIAVDTSSRLSGWRIMGFGLLLVPALWWSRVYFTSSARGREVDPFAIRDFSDIVFGSPATGYPAFQLIRHHVSNAGTDLLYLVKFIVSMPVPRSLWANKPTDLDTILQLTYRLSENPSSFWFGELHYMFGSFSLPAAFLVGFAIHYLADRLRHAPAVLQRTLAAVLFMQSLTLFKNGFAMATLLFLAFFCALGLAWVLSRSADREHHISFEGA